MNVLKFIGAAISKKYAAKILPDVLAWAITKGMNYFISKSPDKVQKVQEISTELTKALAATVSAFEDGVVTSEEVRTQIELYKDLFN